MLRGPPRTHGAGQDVVDAALVDDAGADAVVRADAAQAAEASTTMAEDGAVLEDAMQALPDAPGGAACRRDSDCLRDPAGTVCGLMTMRCGTMR
ncbi:MAG: hypothetical protein U0325_05890 [Polyangiales bacterium]